MGNNKYNNKYTEKVMGPVVRESHSVMEVMRRLGIPKYAGGTHSHISKVIRTLGLDTTHFMGQASNKGKFFPKKKPEEVLVISNSGRRAYTSHLRRALLESGVPYICSKCPTAGIWCDLELVLQINHKNSNFLDNRKENLEFLCPNCHSQTDGWNGRKKQPDVKRLIDYIAVGGRTQARPIKTRLESEVSRVKNSIRRRVSNCSACDSPIIGNTKTGLCRACVPFSKRRFNASKEELESLTNTLPMTKIGEMFGVSDTAVKKRCKKLGIELGNPRSRSAILYQRSKK